MSIRHLSLVTGIVGVALSASAAPPPLAQRVVQPDILRENVRSDERGVHAPRQGFAANAADSLFGAGTGEWTLLGPPGGDIADVAASPTQPGVVLAGIAPGGSWGGTMYRSTDSGASWTPVSDFAGISVRDIEFAPDGTVYAATQDSVWTSDDDGATWTHQNLGIDPNNDDVFDIAIDPANPLTIWAGVTAAGGFQPVNVMRSINGGVDWEDRTPAGHDTAMSCAGIAIDPNDPDTVIAVSAVTSAAARCG